MAQKDEDFDAVRKEVAAEIAAINAGKPNHEDLVRELAVTKLLLRYAETTAAYRSEAFSALEQSIQTARESVTLLETERQLNETLKEQQSKLINLLPKVFKAGEKSLSKRMKGTSPSRVIRAAAGYGIKVPRWEVRSLINSLVFWKGKSMSAIVTIGIDLAKNVFAVHGVNATGQPALVRPSVPRAKLLELFASLPPCLIGMEACSGAHHWAREFQRFGHTVRLMAPKFVIPYRLSGKRGKNDAADAAAICEAVTRPNMRFVPIKSIEQQGQLLVHRARQGFVEQRTATLNRIRGLLSELGIVLPLKAAVVRREALARLEDLPGWANTVIGDLLSEVSRLDERIAQYDQHIKTMARQSTEAQRLMQLSGIGETTATALLSTIGNGRDFKCGRQLCAWLGLVPGQYSSGGKQRLGRITKAGDPYLRSLLVLGARAVLVAAKNKTDPISRWAVSLAQRRGYWKAIVAIAAKNARMCWAVLSKGEDFHLPA